MSEGRTSAAQADVEGEDRPVDGPATTGADDVTGSAGTNGHESTTTTAHEDDASAARKSELADDKPERSDVEESEGTRDEGATETVPAATLPGDEPATTSSTGSTSSTDTTTAAGATTHDTTTPEPAGDEEWAEAEDKAYKKEMRKGFAFGTIGGVLVGAIVALLLGALVWPGYLLGPGDPQDTANQVTQALSSKDSGALDGLSCKGPNGAPVTQLSAQVLQYITKVAPAGPTTTLIDTEARTPVDLTLSVQGQTQTLPSELVLGETKGDWCLKGLAQRQPQ